MYYELTDGFDVTADAAKTWDFFSNAENLPAITPPWLGFKIKTPSPIVIGKDSLLDYTVKWAGFPIKWRTLIVDWQPPHSFMDLQLRGPYNLWLHQHTFEPIDGGTRCADRVLYKLPMGLLARPVHALLVKKQLMEIFGYRRKVIGERLGFKGSPRDDVRIRKV